MNSYNPRTRRRKTKGLSEPQLNNSGSVTHHLILDISDDFKGLLERIEENLRLIVSQDEAPNEIATEAFLEIVEEQETKEMIDEPRELSVGIPEPLLMSEKLNIISATDVTWNKIPGNKLFDWREDGNTLILRYSHITHDTNWETIRYLLQFQGGRGGTRTPEILKIIGSKTSKKVVAFRTFCRCIEDGIIQAPWGKDEIEPVKKTLVDGWNVASSCRYLQWRDIDGQLEIKYLNVIINSTWPFMKKLSELSVQARTAEIHRKIRSEEEADTKARFSAYNTFAKMIQSGEIVIPRNPFLEPIDPDKPLLSSLNLTRVKDDCGEGAEC